MSACEPVTLVSVILSVGASSSCQCETVRCYKQLSDKVHLMMMGTATATAIKDDGDVNDIDERVNILVKIC